MLTRWLGWAEKLSQVAVWAGGGLLVFAAFMVTVDVLARKFFSVTMAGSDEISGYLFAISTAFAFSYALLHRANVRIDALYLLLPRRVCALLDLFGLLLLALFASVLTWRAALLARDSIHYWSRSITPMQTPLAIPQTLWVVGLTLFVLTLVLVIAACSVALFRGDLATVQRIAGVRTLDEEVEEEAGITLHTDADPAPAAPRRDD